MLVLTAVSLVLLFISLCAIYVVLPMNMLLLLNIAIFAVCSLLAIVGRSRERILLCVFALCISAAAAGVVGMVWNGTAGAAIGMTGWIAVLYLLGTIVWRSSTDVPSGSVMLISRPGGVRYREGPARIMPPLPTFERHEATLPVYELKSTVSVEKINTQSLQDVQKIILEMHYVVRDPLKVLSGLPNRSRLIHDMAEELNTSRDKAMTDPNFWEHLLHRQITDEAEGMLRNAVYEKINRAVDSSPKRQELAGEVQERLSSSVRRWGVEIRSLEVNDVILDPGQIQRSKREFTIKREIEDAERKSRIEAQQIAEMGKAQAEVQAHAIAHWIEAIKSQNINLSAQDIERIVLNVVEEMGERRNRVFLAGGRNQHGELEREVGGRNGQSVSR